MEIGFVYFFTATINSWIRLLESDLFKQIIIDSLTYLSMQNKISVYGFVIMPNHIHLIWKTEELNGKETAQGSLLKYTAYMFKKILKQTNPLLLQRFAVEAENKSCEFWQRDSLAFRLIKKDTALQKLNYIHNNPLAKHWNLSATPESYYYSSASYYENNDKRFGFLKNLSNEF